MCNVMWLYLMMQQRLYLFFFTTFEGFLELPLLATLYDILYYSMPSIKSHV